jgi:hypothetical protein
MKTILNFLFVLLLNTSALGQASSDEIISHKIRSKYLGGVETAIHVLKPSKMDDGKRYPVLYILPVIDGDAAWGKPFKIAQEENFPDKYGVICVMATFPRGTLYCNHPTKKNQQDESYFVQDVVPFVDQNYPTIAQAEGRYLTGFCASGSGGLWLLLRHLDMFGKVAAWDAWLDLDEMIEADEKLFGTNENYRDYAVLNQIDRHAHELIDGPTRIVMMAYRNKRDGVHSVHRFHDKLFDYGIAHIFEFHEAEAHRWDSGWLSRAVEYLFLERLPEGVGKTLGTPKTEAQIAALHRGAVNRRRRIILHHDAALDRFKPSMKMEEVVENTYAFSKDPKSQIDTVMLDVGGGAVPWPSKHMSQISGLQDWFSKGNDFLPAVVKAGHERGLEIFFSYRINGIANLSPEPLKRKRSSWLLDWREDPEPPHDPRIPWDHSNWQTGKKGKWGGDAALWNYAIPEVQALQIEAIRELVSGHEIEGIQLDFVRHAPYLPVGRQWEYRDRLTEFLSSVRAMIREVEMEKGRAILLGVKVASSVSGCHFDGIDIERWVGDGLVDIVAVGARSLEVDLGGFKDIIGHKKVKLYPSHDRHHGSDGYSYPPLRYHRAVMANFWRQKPDGVMLINFGGGRIDGRAGKKDDSLGFREFGQLATLRGKEMTYVIQRRAGGHPWEFGHPEDGKFQPWSFANSNLLAVLPAKLGQHGKGLTYLKLDIGELGPKAKLRVLFSDPGAAGDTIPVGSTYYRYGNSNYRVRPLAKSVVNRIESRLNNIRLGQAEVRDDGWLEWSVDVKFLAVGENLLSFRVQGLEAGHTESISIECLEIDVE